MYKRGQSLTEILFAGRWDSLKSLNHYLQEGMAAYAASKLPGERRELVASLANMLPALARSSKSVSP